MPTRLIEIVERLPRSRIVLIGDLMLDRYLYGNAERLSPDAPVPILHYKHEDARLGGAGRVAADLATLGAEVRVVSLLGADDTGRQVRDLLRACGCNVDGVLDVRRPAVHQQGAARRPRPAPPPAADDAAGLRGRLADRRGDGRARPGRVPAGDRGGQGGLPGGLQQGAAQGAAVPGGRSGWRGRAGCRCSWTRPRSRIIPSTPGRRPSRPTAPRRRRRPACPAPPRTSTARWPSGCCATWGWTRPC